MAYIQETFLNDAVRQNCGNPNCFAPNIICGECNIVEEHEPVENRFEILDL